MSLGAAAFFVLADRGYPTPESAALKCATVRACLQSGYSVADIVCRPFDYAGSAEAERSWGTVVLQMRPTDPRGLDDGAWVIVTCTVQCQVRSEVSNYRVTYQDKVEMASRR